MKEFIKKFKFYLDFITEFTFKISQIFLLFILVVFVLLVLIIIAAYERIKEGLWDLIITVQMRHWML